MRAIPFCLALAVLGTATAHADGLSVGEQPPCPDRQYVIEFVALQRPDLKPEIYTGQDAQAIRTGLDERSVKASEIMVFKNDERGTRWIIGFRDGCMEGNTIVDEATFRAWLAGQEAGK